MVVNDVVMYCLAVCSAIITIFLMEGFIEDLVRKHKKEKMEETKIDYKDDRLEEIYYRIDQLCTEVYKMNQSIKRVESKLGDYRKEVQKHFNHDNNMYNKNLDAIAKDIQGIYDKFELLNQQPEKKKEDNSALWGALSGILSGVLSSALMKGLDGSKESSEKKAEQTDENVCYAVRKKGSEEWLDQRFDSIEQIAQWLNENGFSADDYDIGKVKPNSEETQE